MGRDGLEWIEGFPSRWGALETVWYGMVWYIEFAGLDTCLTV